MQTTPPPNPNPRRISRRQALAWLAIGVIGTVVLAGLDGLRITSDRPSLLEQDLGAIGAGLPTVVQIQDPASQECTTLQGITRRVIDGGFDGDINFRVASLTNEDGRALADQHGLTSCALLLFDSTGQLTDVLTGPRRAVQLEAHFANLVASDI